MRKIFKCIVSVVLVCITMTMTLLAGTTGKIAGKVIDAMTKEPLVGANVILNGTSLGASTDIDGEYYKLSRCRKNHSAGTNL